MLATKAYAAPAPKTALAPFEIQRREPGPHDVLFDVTHCGICHSDIHAVDGDLQGMQLFPMVPGHEIVGRVKQVGSAVTKHKVGDVVAVGCIINSCRECAPCKHSEEQFCSGGWTGTFGGFERDGKTPTYGGYSTQMTIDEDYVLKISPKLDPAAAAPLLCAGITTYSPLRHWKVGKGSKVAVIGLGGLGHMAVKFAAAMGAEVTVLSTTDKKKVDANRLGAKEFAVTTDAETFTRLANKFDLILNTVSSDIDYTAYLGLLNRDGTLVILGISSAPVTLSAFGLLPQRRNLSASMIGGIKETQEMLDFCAEHGIVSDIEVIRMDQVNEAYARIMKSDVRYRFVIDMATL